MARSRKTKNGATKGFLKALNAMPLSKPSEPMTTKPEWNEHYKYGQPYGSGYDDGWRDAQTKLLRYLIETTPAPYLIMADRIKSMLKQIQEAQK